MNDEGYRQKKPPAMHLTKRDLRILEAIYAFDGMLGAHQFMQLPNSEGKPEFTSWRTTRERLSKLYQNGYIDRPDRRWRAALDDMIYWLTEKGAEAVAGLAGTSVDEFEWQGEPKRSLVDHNLKVNDFRLDVLEACHSTSGFEVAEWIVESEFRKHSDRVEYVNEHGKKAYRYLRPDAFFVIRGWSEARGKAVLSPLLLELDMSTHDNPSFGREKVRPGVAYLRSEAYQERFGYKSGRWLVVTTGERRMRNMKRQTETAGGNHAGTFYFTWFDQVSPQSVLTEPIWYQGSVDEPVALFT